MSSDDAIPNDQPMLATCGHEDPMAYLIGAPCGPCTRERLRDAFGAKPRRPRRR